jgi:hypothetical protein
MKPILRAFLLFTTFPLALLAAEPTPVEFTVKLETVMKHDDGKFLWFHPRTESGGDKSCKL